MCDVQHVICVVRYMMCDVRWKVSRTPSTILYGLKLFNNNHSWLCKRPDVCRKTMVLSKFIKKFCGGAKL